MHRCAWDPLRVPCTRGPLCVPCSRDPLCVPCSRFRITFHVNVEQIREHNLQILHKNALRVQRHVRGMLGRKKFQEEWHHRDHNSRVIQRAYNRYKAKNQVNLLLRCFHAASTTLQAWWRGQLAREVFYWRKKWTIPAVIVIQTAWRGKYCRMLLADMKRDYTRASLKIQKAWRNYRSCATMMWWCYKIYAVAVRKLQSWWLRYKFRSTVRMKMNQRRISTIQLQAWTRMLLMKRLLRRLRRRKKLQRCFRCINAAVRLREGPRRQLNIITWVQRRVKLNIYRRRMESLVTTQRVKVRIIQRMVRGLLGRAKARVKRKRVLMLQRVMRGALGRIAVRNMKKYHSSATAERAEGIQEMSRLLSVYAKDEQTGRFNLMEAVRIADTMTLFKSKIRHAYILASMQGNLDSSEHFFMVNKAQIKAMLGKMKAPDGRTVMESLGSNTLDLHFISANQVLCRSLA